MIERASPLVLSCEHAGNDVPGEYEDLFAGPEAREALGGHRGWDPGAMDIARQLAAALDAPLVAQSITRLLVECNRSLDHPSLWSEFSRRMSDDRKLDALDRFWHAHRGEVEAQVRRAAECGPVVHLGVHTFTPVWNGRARGTHIGILYDPRREPERTVAVGLRDAIRCELGGMDGPHRRSRNASGAGVLAAGVHLNRPYRGWTDGLTTTLRGQLPADRYLGLEIEVSQGLAADIGPVSKAILAGLSTILRGHRPAQGRPSPVG